MGVAEQSRRDCVHARRFNRPIRGLRFGERPIHDRERLASSGAQDPPGISSAVDSESARRELQFQHKWYDDLRRANRHERRVKHGEIVVILRGGG
jgi:hypothetical protein